MSKKDHSPLLIPALRAFMGSWAYYVGVMQMRDIAERVSIVEDIHSSENLREFLQRRLTGRSGEIADYLLNQDQRFFNSLVIGTYGGQPQWIELGVKAKDEAQEERLLHLEGMVGFLELSGNETLFAIDGQHRVAGIKNALQQDDGIGSEEVSVIFVPGITQDHRLNDPEGFERTRRLFTTLNRYAKPVNKKDIIALDEDDAVAIVTRLLIDEHPLFKDKISFQGANSVNKADKVSLTTITNLYDILDIYLGYDINTLMFRKRIRPSEQILDSMYQKCTLLFDRLVDSFPSLRELRESTPKQKIASRYRRPDGGSILFRPIGLKMLVTVIVDLCRQELSMDEALLRLSGVELELSKEPWAGLIWNMSSNRMITAAENQKAARLLLLYSVGGSLEEVGSDTEKLIRELSGLMNRPSEDIVLPRYHD